MSFGKCHLCGRTLVLHSWFVADGCQHEEYYCDGCGDFNRGMFPLRLEDPAWRTVYQRRQELIEKGPRRHGRLHDHRRKAEIIQQWAEQVRDLGQRLLDAADGPDDPNASDQSDVADQEPIQ